MRFSRVVACAAMLAAVLLAPLLFIRPAAAAELLMFRQAGCVYCATWDRVIAPVYPRTDIGRAVPVRMLDLSDEQPGLDRPVRFTPTFVLFADGREVGRIEGYPGEDFFWGLLERLVKNLPPGS